ncbi:hypothetical protein [Brevundimonas sp.]|uniref:hypothetical protein n=1 Tax=Brevundimonas sp. TaxID=1871086 RepID=UPI002D46F7FD|nr:hypothetical protein [Brevundimonas sp.]HYC97764.1 hypothetical protein [Brevundimonas sp.]
MLTPSLIILALLVLGVGIVIWAARRKPAGPSPGPDEADTAWNDPITPAETPTHPASTPRQDPRP